MYAVFKEWLSSKCSKPGSNPPGMPWISMKWASCMWRAFLRPHVFNVKPTSCPSNSRPEALLPFSQKSEGFGMTLLTRLFKKDAGEMEPFPLSKFPRKKIVPLTLDMSLALSRVESCLKIKARASDCLMASLKTSIRIWRQGISLISFPLLATESEWRGALWESTPWDDSRCCKEQGESPCFF